MPLDGNDHDRPVTAVRLLDVVVKLLATRTVPLVVRNPAVLISTAFVPPC